jgi:hypothetical protein
MLHIVRVNTLQKTMLPTEQEAVWCQVTVWTMSRTENSFASNRYSITADSKLLLLVIVTTHK